MVTLPNIGLFDFYLGFLYLSLIYLLAYFYQKKKRINNPEYRYFLFGLSTKIIGAIAFVIISIYYYKKGDTFLYFQIAEELRRNLFTNFSETLNLISSNYSDLAQLDYHPLQKYNYYYERSSTWFFTKIVFFFNLISFGSYLVSSILFSVISFSGIWICYIGLSRLYSQASKLMLIPFFLIPTALIWSSGILKDTLIMGIVGILINSVSESILFKKRMPLNVLLIAICFLVIHLLRPIFLIIFIPCLLIWVLPYLTESIKKPFVRLFIKISFFVIVIAGVWFMNNKFLDVESKYRIENLFQTLQGFQSFHSMEVFAKGQSIYTFGGVISSPVEIVKKIPEAINVTFFRPYFWEVTNWAMLLGALESFLLLFMFIYVLIILKKNFFKILWGDNKLMFMMTFALIFAFVVGISSYNFGALSRYKIPATFLFIISLIIIYTNAEKNQRIF